MNARYQGFHSSIQPTAFHPLLCLLLALSVLIVAAKPCWADDGYWSITQTAIQNALGPQINDSGEMVWFLNSDGGVYSSVRGQLASSGLFPKLANSGEVVYAGYFGGPNWDLVSTTRGRLTYGGIIDVNLSLYDVNSSGEVVYVERDANGYVQVYSTVRGQVTFDATDHYSPCINDNGEIVWSEYVSGVGSRTFSSTRGMLPESYGFYPLDLNNLGDLCYMGNLYSATAGYTSPHIFSSAHGVLINNPDLYQWDGGINDAGTIVWDAPVTPGSSTWYVYQGQWVVPEPSALALLSLGGVALLHRAKAKRPGDR
jgi:hypothetical protein